MKPHLLFIGVARQEGALLFEIILIDHGIEVTVSEAIGILSYLVGRTDIGLRPRKVILVGKQKVKLDLGVIDGIGADDLIEMVPLAHDLVVGTDKWRH